LFKVGLAVKPKTPVEEILPALDTGLFDMALVGAKANSIPISILGCAKLKIGTQNWN
jgi:hypothetical protein